jgi:hypothetical protein
MLSESAAEFVDLAVQGKPELIIHRGDLPATAEALRDLLAMDPDLYDRDGPVRVIAPIDGGPPFAKALTQNNVVIEAHRHCQPVKVNAKGEHIPETCPERLARMYLDKTGDWDLRPLAGICTSPLLSGDGTLRARQGYDPATHLLCWRVPNIKVPPNPSIADAKAAFKFVRERFRTFPFADSPRCMDSSGGVETVDITKPPGRDESAYLIGLLTAVCRASLALAPGLLLTAPSISGAGTGKGLLVRAASEIAFGISPRAFTSGGNRTEMDKRIVAELIEAQPIFFLDNVNSVELKSDTLASVITERPARVRVLGVSRMAGLNSAAFIAITGNGVTLTEDLVRRFIWCELNAHCEDPELRDFAPGFLEEVRQSRSELLTALLTIWRWGRDHVLNRGKPLGSFETWAEWCRDPLIALGCQDPVERIQAIKAIDPHRQQIIELFRAWSQEHGNEPMTAHQLSERVIDIINPQKRGRQYVARFLSKLAGTQAAGFVLTRQLPAGRWTAATYSLGEVTPS